MTTSIKPVLCVVTSAPIKGRSGIPTGFFLAELTHALDEIEKAGLKTVIASVRGGIPPIDGFDLTDTINAKYWNELDLYNRLENTPALSELDGADYSAVFFAGGHGTMWDFAQSVEVHRIISEVYTSGGAVSAVCHGPAAFVGAKLPNGEFVVKGKNIAAFTNTEEVEVGGDKLVPYMLQTELEKQGAIHHAAPNWAENVIVDGQLITGQNPASAKGVGAALVKVLLG